MNILIAGGTGLIGTELVNSLLPTHEITVLTRQKNHVTQTFGDRVTPCTWDELATLDALSFDAVINLAGHNIADSRWTENTKQLIIDSRVNTNALLINWLIESQAKPHFYSANAVGIYGAQEGDDLKTFDEETPIPFDKPIDFLSEVGILWQQSLEPAIQYGMPVTITRFGVVLKQGNGMLGKLAPTFKLGLGSIISDGKQVISWVHIDDVVRGYHFLLNNPNLVGPFNLTSPNPVSQREFAKTFAHVLHRPLFLKTPAFVIRTLFGEMGEYLINRGQRVVPKRLLEAGFEFKYPTIQQALEEEYPH
ncbi:TIGR01777 family oxidoreductase [Legionella impletisoli]|uniref:Nucleoside-diphosphate sugar epimerase n=1 Tax=Legionella impletisoli TaxID=343510 RepID=A0A917NEA1_9GAMM|nr:TIGR01777 family oxidoreductase [Legionella impletisoli]GGI89422.1 nucleoside-diphosphate sugar epimerase [Legionella impletisoli]